MVGRSNLGGKAEEYTITIAERDESGARALWQLRDRGINLAANALAQAVDHILGFFTRLRTELAFYIGCLHAHQALVQKGEPCASRSRQCRANPNMSARGFTM